MKIAIILELHSEFSVFSLGKTGKAKQEFRKTEMDEFDGKSTNLFLFFSWIRIKDDLFYNSCPLYAGLVQAVPILFFPLIDFYFKW